MRRILAVLALAGFALPAEAQQSISVALDQTQTLTFPAGIAAINVGNPAIADITPIDSRHYFILGKSYGATNVVAVNKDGETIANIHVSVLNGQQATVTLQRGTQRTTYNCTASRCEAAPQPGDGKDSFDTASAQINSHQQAAKGAAAPQGTQ
jgi:hypothetical protein